MSDYSINLIGCKDDETATITTEDRGDLCHITFRYWDRVVESVGTDYFEAFCQIRLHLEDVRLIPVCYGASLNVFPSGMGRDMGPGLSAYRCTLGQQAMSVDLVHIFDSGDDVIPASVAKQRQYHDEWIRSLRR